MEKLTFTLDNNSKNSAHFFLFFWVQTFITILAILNTVFYYALMDFLFSSPWEEFFGDSLTEFLPIFFCFSTCALWFLIDYKILKNYIFTNSKGKPFMFMFSWNIGVLVYGLIVSVEYYLGLIGSPFSFNDTPIFVTSVMILLGYLVFMLTIFFLFKYVVFNDKFVVKIEINKP